MYINYSHLIPYKNCSPMLADHYKEGDLTNFFFTSSIKQKE